MKIRKTLASIVGMVTILGSETNAPSNTQSKEIGMQVHRFRDKNGNNEYDRPAETLGIYENRREENRAIIKDIIPGEGSLAFYITTEKFANDVVNAVVIDYSLTPPQVVSTVGNVIDMRDMDTINKRKEKGHSPFIRFDLDSARESRISAGLPLNTRYGVVAIKGDKTYQEGWNVSIDYTIGKTVVSFGK